MVGKRSLVKTKKKINQKRKDLKMEEVKVVRLQTGEELICKVTEKKDTITITNVAIILPAGQGKIGLGEYLPYCEFGDAGMCVKKSHVVFMLDPVDEFKNQYNGAFGSGLVIPDPITSAALTNMNPSGPVGEGSGTGNLKLVK